MIGSATVHNELMALENENTIWQPQQTAAPEGHIFIPTWNNQPEAKKPVVELSNVKILSRGNISMITAGAGTGKSSLLEAGCASAITPMIDSLGIVFHASSILYIDTERSTFDHHISWQRFMRRAGIEKGAITPEAVKWENIRGIEALEDRLHYLWSRIDSDTPPELTIIDGIGDFLADTNATEECTALVSRLCSVVHNRDISLLLSLHNNPAINSTKARGVLGSELWRKCESVLIIEKLEGGIRRVTTDYALGKNRSASDTVASCFRWDDKQKMHVSCDAPASKVGKTSSQLEDFIEQMGSKKWAFTDLRSMIINVTGKSTRTAERKISDLINSKRIIKAANNTYSVKTVDIPEYIHD